MLATTVNYDVLQMELTSLMDSLQCDAVKAHEDYERLYNTIAKGSERPDNATICNILRNAEKTPDDLKADVEWRVGRMKMIEEYQSIPGLEAESQKEHAILAQLQQDWAAVKAKHEAECWPHECRISQIRQQLNDLWRHEQLLKEGCRCEALRVGRDNAQHQIARICEERRTIDNKMADLRYEARQAQCVVDEKAFYLGVEMKKEEAKLIVANNQREIEKLQKQVDKLDLKIAEYNAEIARIEAEMILE